MGLESGCTPKIHRFYSGKMGFGTNGSVFGQDVIKCGGGRNVHPSCVSNGGSVDVAQHDDVGGMIARQHNARFGLGTERFQAHDTLRREALPAHPVDFGVSWMERTSL